MRITSIALGAIVVASRAFAFEDFDARAVERWQFVTDGVMGGVLIGTAGLESGSARLQGQVSNANNGGFLQIRRTVLEPWRADATGLRLQVRGNGEIYYVFLRTPAARRVNWSYRATFKTSDAWQFAEIPFSAFTPSSAGLPQEFAPDEVRSIGIVAYGRDHDVDLSIRGIAVY